MTTQERGRKFYVVGLDGVKERYIYKEEHIYIYSLTDPLSGSKACDKFELLGDSDTDYIAKFGFKAFRGHVGKATKDKAQAEQHLKVMIGALEEAVETLYVKLDSLQTPQY